jgi:hypothetical protein
MKLSQRFEKVVNRSFVDGVILGGGCGKIVEQLVSLAVIASSPKGGSIRAEITAAILWAVVVIIGLWVSAHWTAIEDVAD